MVWRLARTAGSALRLLALTVLFLAGTGLGVARAQESVQDPTQVLELSGRPGVGDVIHLVLRKEQERQVPNRPAQRSSSLLRVTLEVLESGAQGMVVRWSHSRPVDVAAPPAGEAADEADVIWELVQDIHYDLEFDAGGEFVRLRNYEEVRPLVDRMLSEIGAILGKRGNAAAAEQATALVRRMFSSRSNLESVLLREPRLFFHPMGKRFVLDAPREYDAQLPNPFGGAGLPAHGTLRVDWIDRNRGLAAVTMEQTLHPDSVRIAVESLLQRMPPERRPQNLDPAAIKVEVRELARYTVNLQDGLPERMDFTRTTRVPGGYRRDVVGVQRTD